MNFCSDDLHLHPCSMAYAAASHLPPNSPVWPLTIAPGAQLLLSACVTSANYQRTWMTIRRKERRAECMWQSAASFSPRSLPTPPPSCLLPRSLVPEMAKLCSSSSSPPQTSCQPASPSVGMREVGPLHHHEDRLRLWRTVYGLFSPLFRTCRVLLSIFLVN